MSVPDEPDASGTTTSLRSRIDALGSRLAPATRAVGDATRRLWRPLRWVAAVGAVLLVIGLAGFAYLWATVELPDEPRAASSTVVLAADGTELALFARDGIRLDVPLADVPAHTVDALIASEDRNFYDHSGIDPIGIVRAVVSNVRTDRVQGGSTITQQLVKNEFLTSERTLSRKLDEALLSLKLERQTDKTDILERYLNTVYFGRGAYGIEAAARAYFDVAATDLTVEQSALLVAMLPAPEARDPETDRDIAEASRNAVLAAMVETGTLDDQAAAAATSTPIETIPAESTVTLSAGLAPHFVEMIRSQASDLIGEDALYANGLIIQTTLDIDDQTAAEAAVAKHLDDPDDPQAALIGIQADGAIRAWVGGRDFAALRVDLARGADGGGSGRQPGSTFKPIALATALEQGLSAGEVYSSPAEITLDTEAGPWTVANAGSRAYGEVSLIDATANSMNTVYAQVADRVGAAAIVDMAERLGVDSPLDPNVSIALGTEEVAPRDMAEAYLTLARRGDHVEPYAIESIETSTGRVLHRRDRTTEQVVEQDVADTVNHILQETPRRGTATAAALDRPMAAKTGTTQDSADAWLAGYTPEYAAVVWVGRAEGAIPLEVDGRAVFGGSVPAAIWHDFMVDALSDVPETDFPPPDDALLRQAGLERTLELAPVTADPGDTVTASGSGYRNCTQGWVVVASGPDEAPATPEQAPATIEFRSETVNGSVDDERSATLVVPDDAPAGTYQVLAFCDAGGGVKSVAEATLTVDGIVPTTTTSSSSSTTSTTSSSTTSTTSSSTTSTTSTSTSTSSSTSSTTTTKPEKKD